MKYALCTAIMLALLASPASAHYNMLLPQAASAKKGEPVTFVYQWGHPFEHQLFDSPAPESIVVLSPDAKKADLSKASERVTVLTADQKKVAGYRLRFTPEDRGDYVFVLSTPPIWIEEDQEFLQDMVKVVLHVQAQKGWDATAGQAFEMVPLTRPYGLQPSMVFQRRRWRRANRWLVRSLRSSVTTLFLRKKCPPMSTSRGRPRPIPTAS